MKHACRQSGKSALSTVLSISALLRTFTHLTIFFIHCGKCVGLYLKVPIENMQWWCMLQALRNWLVCYWMFEHKPIPTFNANPKSHYGKRIYENYSHQILTAIAFSKCLLWKIDQLIDWSGDWLIDIILKDNYYVIMYTC